MTVDLATLQALQLAGGELATGCHLQCLFQDFVKQISLLCELSEFLPLLQRSIFEREYWVHPINLQRNVFGEYHHLVSDLAHRFCSYFRMLPSTFSALLNLVHCKLTKQETAFKWPVTAGEEEEKIGSTIITMIIIYSYFHNYHHDYD